MSFAWDSSICNETSGFLFRHACPRLPIDVCTQCGKPVCELHALSGDSGTLCASCGGTKQEETDDVDDSASDSGYYSYGPTYRRGWSNDSGSHDPHALTEADAEHLRQEGQEPFENELDES